MRLKVRDLVATLLVAAVAVPYVAVRSASHQPAAPDASTVRVSARHA
jgi:hypothetical protein